MVDCADSHGSGCKCLTNSYFFNCSQRQLLVPRVRSNSTSALAHARNCAILAVLLVALLDRTRSRISTGKMGKTLRRVAPMPSESQQRTRAVCAKRAFAPPSHRTLLPRERLAVVFLLRAPAGEGVPTRLLSPIGRSEHN